MKRAEILHEAEKCVCGKREQDYGAPENNFRTIARLWTNYLDAKTLDLETGITAEDVAVMMALFKIARIASGTGTDDSFVDACGYLACGGEIVAGKRVDSATLYGSNGGTYTIASK